MKIIDESNELSLAAPYIIGQDKVIKYTFLDADYRIFRC
tara:strand:- start:2502 stop:2618 length:117 start_codon:yes stop_codon:yes gene_type:complete